MNKVLDLGIDGDLRTRLTPRKLENATNGKILDIHKGFIKIK